MGIDRLYYGNVTRNTLWGGGITGGGRNSCAGDQRLETVLGPIDTVVANKMVRALAMNGETPGISVTPSQHTTGRGLQNPDTFKPGPELLYGGQGKIKCNVNLGEFNVISGNDRGDIPTSTDALQVEHEGLGPPRLGDSGKEVTGDDSRRLRIQNKHRKQRLRAIQLPGSQWTEHTGQVTYDSTPLPRTRPPHRNFMCPTGRALNHPAATLLREWSTLGCPTRTGRHWTKGEIWAAVERGPHRSATSPEALKHFEEEIKEKLHKNQARLVAWDTIKDNPPAQLKISPIAAIPHKSKAFRSILDLSFRLRLQNGGVLAAVNDTTIKCAPKGAINQLGECLTRIIHAFAETHTDTKIFMAKWDIKDGFWRMDCREGEEWNFAYVLPQPKDAPTMIVVPTSLQMGWIESPPYFCAATETARDIVTEYTNMPVGSLPPHKFVTYTTNGRSYTDLPDKHEDQRFSTLVEVYVDDFMSLVIPVSKAQLTHTASAVMTGIHDVFPANDVDEGDDPISVKKLKQQDGQ